MSQCSEILTWIVLAATIVFTGGFYCVHRVTMRLVFENKYYRILLTDFARGRLSAEHMTKLSRDAIWQTTGLKQHPPADDGPNHGP